MKWWQVTLSYVQLDERVNKRALDGHVLSRFQPAPEVTQLSSLCEDPKNAPTGDGLVFLSWAPV